ncbi:hypothetical protein AwWohl_14650 [Gammaproteobacteria bacterium]|nr:hypothetical protein AwWohl_14650 [Gammaproteobacteria bacterium]
MSSKLLILGVSLAALALFIYKNKAPKAPVITATDNSFTIEIPDGFTNSIADKNTMLSQGSGGVPAEEIVLLQYKGSKISGDMVYATSTPFASQGEKLNNIDEYIEFMKAQTKTDNITFAKVEGSTDEMASSAKIDRRGVSFYQSCRTRIGRILTMVCVIAPTANGSGEVDAILKSIKFL